MMSIRHRLQELRAVMKVSGLDAYLITGTDPHLSEYTPERWQTRAFISGFTGSYGKVLVTEEAALLWTDTRYFLQAKDELNGTGISLMKERVPDAVSLEDWIIENLRPGQVLGLDGRTISTEDASQLSTKLTAKSIGFDPESDLVARIWFNRPICQDRLIFEHLETYTGKDRKEKFEIIRGAMISRGVEAIVVSMLDDVSWMFNLRGEEIPYIPVIKAFCYLNLENVWLFIEPETLPAAIRIRLDSEGVTLMKYTEFSGFIAQVRNCRIQIDPLRTNYSISNALSAQNSIVPSVSIVSLLKSQKNFVEIECIRQAHRKDGAAMAGFLCWLHQSLGKELMTETSLAGKLLEFRCLQPLFIGDSFHPIIGYGAHGAIVHYHASDKTDTKIIGDNLLLIDSGGQYLDGTTDITRTIGLGSVSYQQKKDFTICLKGHIALAKAIFPEGTKGYSLDPIARKPLWDNSINYGHGTGHGIGFFLSVHEGPMSIRTEFNNEPIREGHLLSNEPGIYREGEYGIRTENVMLCRKFDSSPFGNFLCFETISLCPIDRTLISYQLLSQEEIHWINDYHNQVYQQISPLIADDEVLEWLKKQCFPLIETD
jgi:Xaa-Pro aminopeptidase